jgi:WS/DGAT/MGAT family acyltransferase
MPARIDRLSGADLTFLRLETHSAPAHIAALAILEGSVLTDGHGRLDIEDLRDRIGRRLTRVPELRRRLYAPPLLGGGLLWVDDGAFDIRHHVRQGAVEQPGDEPELLASAARLLESLLDRHRPLWELWFLTGLSGGRVGLVIKLHHALADGMAAVSVIDSLFDFTPRAPDPEVATWKAEPVPGYQRLLADNLTARLASLRRAAKGLRYLPATMGDFWRMLRDREKAPHCSLNQPIHSGRHIRFMRVDLAAAKERAHQAEGKLNDVVLALVGAGLRELLIGRGEPVDGVELLVSVPVSLRSRSSSLSPAAGTGNDSGGMVVPLSVGEPDPERALARVVQATRRAKAEQHPVFIKHFMAAVAATPIGRLMVEHQRWINLFVTNVPGPPMPLYVLGARIMDVVPIVGVAGNATMAVCAFSYTGRLYLVANVDATACPDVDVFMAGLERAWGRLGGGGTGSRGRWPERSPQAKRVHRHPLLPHPRKIPGPEHPGQSAVDEKERSKEVP